MNPTNSIEISLRSCLDLIGAIPHRTIIERNKADFAGIAGCLWRKIQRSCSQKFTWGNRRIEFKQLLSKGKIAKLLLGSIAFLGAGLWMSIAQPTTSNSLLNDPIIKNVVAVGGVMMGLLGIYLFTKKLLDKRPGIVVETDGITDHTGALSVGFIIANIQERTVQVSIFSKQQFVTIVLKNPEEYISRQTNKFRRKMMNMNAKSYGSPVDISSNTLQVRHEDLLKLLLAKLMEYQG